MKSLPDISPAPVQPPSKRGGEFALFSKIQGALSHAPNFSKTCKAILDAVMDEMDAENCSLMLKDPTSNQLSVRAARGKKEREATFYSDPTGKGIQFKSGEGIAGWVLEKGQSMLVNNVNQEPRFIKRYACYAHMQSLVCVPIREEDRVVGVFNLSHSKAGAFSEKDKTVLSYVSGQVGAALLSTQFFLNIRPIHPPENGANEIPVEREENPATNSQAPILFDAGEMSPKKRILLDGSERMRRIKELIERVAPTDVTVLVRGESGVGKEVVARFIHESSSRRDKPFIKVNCAAIPQDLLESEFFGYEKGAFTGAYGQKLGKFEVANGGTIFLDEIVEIPHSLQAKLLQVLQDREFARLGGNKDVRVDTRIIAATNRNVEEFVRDGQFREDLYYRINVVEILIPPLRDRKEEIPIFIEYFLDKFSKKYNRKVGPLQEYHLTAIQQHHWPGNVRELENAIHRFVVGGNKVKLIEGSKPLMSKESGERPQQLTFPFKTGCSLREAHHTAVLQAESEVIQKTLYQTNWNRKKAASLLNISYKRLLYKIKEYGISGQHKFCAAVMFLVYCLNIAGLT